MKRAAKFSFTATGFVIGVILISLFATSFAVFTADLEDTYNITGDTSFSKYNSTQEILNQTKALRDSTEIKPDDNWLDVIGGYFTRGAGALKIAFSSFGMFEDVISDSSEDFEFMGFFADYFIAIILTGIFLGVIVAAYVKWKV